jgi:PAS domain S-box-containing protein
MSDMRNEAYYTNKIEELESKLKRLAEREGQIIRIIPSALFTVDCAKRILSWNKRAEEITGYSEAEMIGKECTLFSEQPCKERCGLYELECAKPLFGRECTIRCKDGSLKTIAKNIDFIKDESGNVRGGIESFEDISLLKENEEKLRILAREQEALIKERTEELVAANERLVKEIETRMAAEALVRDERDRVKRYMNIAGVIMVLLSDRFEIMMINKKGCESLCVGERDILFHSWFDYFVPSAEKENIEQALKDLTRETTDEASFNYEGSLFGKEGRERVITWTHVSFSDQESGRKFIFSSGMDITELRTQERLLSESEEKFRTLVETSSDFIWEIRPDLVYSYASPQIERILGYTPYSVIGKPVDSFMEQKEGEKLNALLRDSIARLMPFRSIETKRKRADGTDVYLETSGVPVCDSAGKLLYYRGVARDITERKRFENEIIDSKDLLLNQKILLEKKNIALREILGHIEEEKKDIERQVTRNIKKYILPNLQQLALRGTEADKKCIAAIEKDLSAITSGFSVDALRTLADLTPRETEICDWIKKGLSTKEIADILSLSMRTVEAHRNSIRRKLGINGSGSRLLSNL